MHNHQDEETCKTFPISAEDYLRKEMSKFKELIEQFAILNQHEPLND